MLSHTLNPEASGLIRSDGLPVGWAVSTVPVDYLAAVQAMEARVAAIAAGEASELIWLLEHPPLYTAGVSSRESDLLDVSRFPVHRTGRGGQFTYHGPGQRVAYVMLDLNQRGRDVRAFVRSLEAWLIGALAGFGVEAGVRDGRVGVWVERRGAGWSREDKIAAIGVKVRKWISFHGVSLNVEPDLTHFSGIVPCGIAEHGVTSLVDLGVLATMDEADALLKASALEIFGALAPERPPI
ncbi:lipoyl(octanoyl) transferase LipB [uncultured Brevundimonas sp.]|uniref:lipoyl(octanoyl) transferase LipB n=1 Tax=uncultured Brevundimonas sp. TaxID=213418 RepID=UPI0030EE45D3|tara:strand:+ start:62667 stop:63383 length:717 start_codon:yes stop_codon:yes gene_type:complete